MTEPTGGRKKAYLLIMLVLLFILLATAIGG